jgi:hypothetical protein
MPNLPDGCKPFDRSELEKCAKCGKGVGHDRDIVFYEVTVTQVMLDPIAIQQMAGMETYFGGNVPLAHLFVPTTAIATRLPPSRVLFCQTCYLDPDTYLPGVLESHAESEAERRAKAEADSQTEDAETDG